LGAGDFQEFAAGQRGFTTMLTLGVERFAQELDVGDTGDFDRILKAEEQASGCAFMGGESEEV
jgi:hypothetical protein